MTPVDVTTLSGEMTPGMEKIGYVRVAETVFESVIREGVSARLELRQDGTTHDHWSDGVAEDDPLATSIRKRLDQDGDLLFPVISIRDVEIQGLVERHLPNGFVYPIWANALAGLGMVSGLGRYRWSSEVYARPLADDIVTAFSKWGRPWIDFATSPEGLCRVVRYANGPTSRYVAPVACIRIGDPNAARDEIEFQFGIPVRLRPDVSAAFRHFVREIDNAYSLGVTIPE